MRLLWHFYGVCCRPWVFIESNHSYFSRLLMLPGDVGAFRTCLRLLRPSHNIGLCHRIHHVHSSAHELIVPRRISSRHAISLICAAIFNTNLQLSLIGLPVSMICEKRHANKPTKSTWVCLQQLPCGLDRPAPGQETASSIFVTQGRVRRGRSLLFLSDDCGRNEDKQL